MEGDDCEEKGDPRGRRKRKSIKESRSRACDRDRRK